MPLISSTSDEYKARFYRDVDDEHGHQIARRWREVFEKEENSADDALQSVLQDPRYNPAADFDSLQSESFLKSECKS